MTSTPTIPRVDETATDEDARKLVDDLEAMGPTFVKLGQLLSTRADLLPAVYLDALSRLQDDVEPVPFEVIEETVDRRGRCPDLEGLRDLRIDTARQRVARPGAPGRAPERTRRSR